MILTFPSFSHGQSKTHDGIDHTHDYDDEFEDEIIPFVMFALLSSARDIRIDTCEECNRGHNQNE